MENEMPGPGAGPHHRMAIIVQSQPAARIVEFEHKHAIEPLGGHEQIAARNDPQAESETAVLRRGGRQRTPNNMPDQIG